MHMCVSVHLNVCMCVCDFFFFFYPQHLRSLIIDSSDKVGEKRAKWYQKERFKFFLQRADGRYIFAVSIFPMCVYDQ